MQSIKNRRKSWRIWVVILLILVIVCSAIFIILAPKAATPSSANKIPVIKVLQPQSISSNILFTGNTYWGRYINDWSMASSLKYAYPFSRLNEFGRDKYDAWISGLECPLVAGVNMTSAEEDSTLTFNCSPNYLPEAAKWFTAFTLANNHTDNQGVDGFTETKQHLEKAGIQYFGHYDPRVIDDICEVIAMPVTVTENDSGKPTKGNLPVAMCGFHGVFRIPTPEAVAEMQKYSSYMPVVAMPHMGAEYKTVPDQLKVDFYRSLIDGGADMVIGDHPHWIQDTESYKGHLIVYSMGNFIFDQQDQPDVVRSAAINVVMKTNDNSALLKKWLTLGDTCATFKDDCLAQAKKQGLTKLDIKYQFGVVGTNDGDKIVKPATAAQQTDILNRLQWQSTVDKLQPPYSSL